MYRIAIHQLLTILDIRDVTLVQHYTCVEKVYIGVYDTMYP